MTTMYGIANCDTIKKAKNWLTSNDIAFEFHDYKKLGVPQDVIEKAIALHGVDVVVNKRGTTYRKLDDHTKQNINETNAVALLSEHASMIKRPILINNDTLLIGFKTEQYEAEFEKN